MRLGKEEIKTLVGALDYYEQELAIGNILSKKDEMRIAKLKKKLRDLYHERYA